MRLLIIARSLGAVSDQRVLSMPSKTSWPRMISLISTIPETASLGEGEDTTTVHCFLDHTLINSEWFYSFPRGRCHYLRFVGSDHCLTLYVFGSTRKRSGRIFKFDCCLKDNEDVKLLIDSTWNTSLTLSVWKILSCAGQKSPKGVKTITRSFQRLCPCANNLYLGKSFREISQIFSRDAQSLIIS